MEIDRLFPPYDPVPEVLELYREPRTDDYEVVFPDMVEGEPKGDQNLTGDSYMVDLDELNGFLRNIGVDEYRRDQLIGFVWNFYAVRFLVKEFRYYGIKQREDADEKVFAGEDLLCELEAYIAPRHLLTRQVLEGDKRDNEARRENTP